MTTAAQLLYSQLDSVKLAEILKNKEPESLHLDYISALSKAPSYVADNIAKPLSGLANAEGGVILYGIACAGKIQGCDLPDRTEWKLPQGLRDAITEGASRHVSPPILGVTFKTVSDQATGNEVLVVLVPESQTKPHQSLPHKVYFRRFDDDVKPLDHSGVESLFRARLGRELNVFPVIDLYETAYISREEIKLTFINKGNAPALNLQVVFQAGPLGVLIGASGILGIRNEIWRVHFDGYNPEHHLWNDALGKISRGHEGEMIVTYGDLAGASYKIVRKLLGPRGTPGVASTGVIVSSDVVVFRNNFRIS